MNKLKKESTSCWRESKKISAWNGFKKRKKKTQRNWSKNGER